MPSSFESPPVIAGKRRRTVQSYAETIIDHTEEEDAQDLVADDVTVESDIEDVEFDKSRSKKQVAKKRQSLSNKKAKLAVPKKTKQQHFRFMDLSAELRNRIYEMALTNEHGLSLVEKTKAYRRTVIRGPIYDQDSYENSYAYGYRRRRSRKVLKSNSQETAPQQTDLVPNLLAVNKQIYSEGINYLYNQDLFFATTMALHQFLANIGPDNQKRLRGVAIKEWGTGKGAHKAMNHCAFALLAGATNLEHLFIACLVDYGHHTSESLARQVYREMHFFLEAYGRAKGDKRAGVRILELSEENFRGGSGYRRRGCDPQDATEEEVKENFEKALGNLLSTA